MEAVRGPPRFEPQEVRLMQSATAVFLSTNLVIIA